MLSNDAWLEQQLSAELSQSEDLEKLIRMEQFKISQAELRISKVQEGWEKGFYAPEEVQTKINEYRETIARAQSEIGGLRNQMANRSLSSVEAELVRQELKALRDRNLLESTFEERADLVAKLGIKILPSEDLKPRKIFCRLNLAEVNEEREQGGFAKVTFGGANVTFPHAVVLSHSLPACDLSSFRVSWAVSAPTGFVVPLIQLFCSSLQF